jgi:Fe-S cluster biogenesis protein NfuA
VSDSLHQKIETALESIRPYLHADGGDVSLVEITTDQVVRVELKGACKTCSINHMTMKAGIEDTIRKIAPEVKAVEAITH